ncbi:MAG: superoxide dismutase family protein [Firmicutes bacterium]|nr:superoxide dismutase family protein [Bacillota bacterium]
MYNSILSIKQKPQAAAIIRGNSDFSGINGTVLFYQRKSGVLVISQIFGLPKGTNKCDSPVFAFHIHSGTSCTGNGNDYFADSKGHYNPNNCPHPYHEGDMPPLFGCDGYAFSAFFTDRFDIREIIGKTVIIHSKADDFTSQPAGNAGTKIACGVIESR